VLGELGVGEKKKGRFLVAEDSGEAQKGSSKDATEEGDNTQRRDHGIEITLKIPCHEKSRR